MPSLPQTLQVVEVQPVVDDGWVCEAVECMCEVVRTGPCEGERGRGRIVYEILFIPFLQSIPGVS